MFEMQLFKKIQHRLASTKGFTLAETLVSVIFLGLLCLAIGAGTSAALSAQGTISTQNYSNQLLARSIQEINDELAYSLSVEDDDKTFVSATSRTKVQLVSTADGIALDNTMSDATSLLIPSTNGLTPQFANGGTPVFNEGNNTWWYTIVIVDTDGKELASQDMRVVRNIPLEASPETP